MNEYKDQDFLKRHGINQFSQAKQSRDWVVDVWRKSGYAYDSKFNPEERKNSDVLLGQSRLFIPKTYNTIQRLLTEMMETFFFDPDEIVGLKDAKETSAEIKSAVKALLNYRLNNHPINFYQEAYEACLDALKQKVGIFKIYPRVLLAKKEKGRRKETDAEGVEVEVIDFEDVVDKFEPRLECVPPEDLFIDPEATWKDYFKYPLIHRIAKTRDELKRSGFKNVDEVQAVANAKTTEETKAARHWQESPFTVQRDVKEMERIYDYEIWTFMDVNDDGRIESCVYHMLGGPNGPEVIGKDPVENTLPFTFSDFESPRPPFIIGSAMPEAHKAYGKDMAEVTESLQKEVNVLRNQDREAAAIAIRKPLLVNRDAGLDMMALVNRKIGGVVTGDDIGNDAVRELQLSNPVISTSAVSSRNEMDYYEATSITPNQLGMSQRDETATAVSTNQANANKKIANMIRNMAHTLFIPAFNYLLRLEQAYESDAFIQKVTGKVLGWRFANDGVPAWQSIQGDFDLTTEIGVNKQSQLNKYLLIADRMNQTNSTVMQMIQAGVLNPAQARFLNPMWAFKQVMGVLKHKNTAEMELPAMAPPPQAEQKGLASQPRNVADPEQQVGQMNPEMLNEILG